MEYYSAVKAAAALGVSDKTVRAWITDGTLKAKRLTGSTAKNARYAIPASEVERLQKGLQGNGTSASATSTNVATSTEKFASAEQLEQVRMEHSKQIAELYQRINELAEQLALGRSEKAEKTPETQEGVPDAVPLKNVQDVTTETNKAIKPKKSAGRPVGVKAKSEPPVEGAVLAKDFAEQYGVNERTFRDHITKGLGKGEHKEKLEDRKDVIHTRGKPGRENIENEHWILPGKEQAVLDYWQRNKVEHKLPDGWVPLNTFAKEHSLNRNELEQLGRQGIIHGVEHGKWITRDGEKVHVALSLEGQKNALKYYHKG